MAKVDVTMTMFPIAFPLKGYIVEMMHKLHVLKDFICNHKMNGVSFLSFLEVKM